MGQLDGEQARARADQDPAPLHEPQQAPTPKPTSGAQADKMLGSLLGNRATAPTSTEHTFGEAVVGSENNIDQIHAPWNLGDTPAMAHFSVSGDAFELVSQQVMTLKPSGAMKGDDVAYVQHASPKIAFKPRRAGEARGTLTITIKWPMDGHVETQTIGLRGFARELNQAPEHGLAGSTPVHDAPPPPTGPQQLSEKDKRTPLDLGSNKAIDSAVRAADSLGDAQLAGVNLVAQEAAAYTKALPKVQRSVWWDLAEMALTVAAGKIAPLVASKLLPRLLSKTETIEVPYYGKIEHTTKGPNLGPVLTTAIEQGIVAAAGLAVRKGLPEKNPAQTEASPPAHARGRHSSNARIDFFEGQRELVTAQKAHYHAQVEGAIGSVAPLMGTQPGQAEATLLAVQSAFAESTPEATQLQADAIAPAWASTVARLSLGTESAETRNHATRTASKMDATHQLGRDHEGRVKGNDGVLDVFVVSGRIVRVQLNGVSQEIADRLADMTLAQVPMPIRFVLGAPSDDAKATIITRDEAGRVRVSGDIDGHDREENNVKTGASMIERFLSVPLSTLSIEIATDDASGRGP